MSSNPPPHDGLPSSTNNVPPGAWNPQSTANNSVGPSTSLHSAHSGVLLNTPEREFDILTDSMRQRLEEAIERQARTDEDLENMGIDPQEYDEDEIMNGVPDVTVEEYEDLSGPNKRLKFSRAFIHGFFDGVDPYEADKKPDEINELTLSLKHASLDLITAICSNLELAIEIGKHLRPHDIVNLYIASRSFRKAINGHMLSCIRMWIDTKAPEAGKVFHWKLYGRMLIRDPVERKSEVDDTRFLENRWKSAKTNPKNIRLIPGFKYLKMVMSRDRCCREILAMMARMGFLMPKSMYSTLLRLWVLMEISTTRQRQLFLRNEKYWTDQHIYNVQFFLVKLTMAFTHPFFHPVTTDMVELMMGQRGLHPLWQLLMRQRYTNLPELMELKTRYDMRFPRDVWADIQLHNHPTAYNVPLNMVGLGHMEGWGKGLRHLARPDELLPIESVYRGLYLDEHISQMAIWGYIDFETGENLVPTEDEMYISDEEEKLGSVDSSYLWQRKHALKKRWDKLTPEMQEEIKEDDNDERLRGMAWSSVDQYNQRGEWESESESESGPEDEYDMNAEIERGYRLPSLFGKHPKKKDKVNETEIANPLFTFGEDPTTWNIAFSELHINSNPQVTYEQFQEARGWQRYMDAGNTGDHPAGPLTNNQTMFAQNQLAILVDQEVGDEADDEDEGDYDEEEEYFEGEGDEGNFDSIGQ